MINEKKNHENILSKLSIEKLNEMQLEAQKAIENNPDIVLLSPTGTGKTLAFLLPIIAALDAACKDVQVLILVPSRELAIQIEQVIREMGTGYKTNAVYGGRAGSQDRIDLKQAPTILVGTPGRVADHMRNETFSTEFIHTLVLDEFDKSLEVGFEADMIEIVDALENVKKKILTSATQKVKIPKFVGIENPKHLNFLSEKITQLALKTIISPYEDKLETLVATLNHIGNQPGIIFCNFKNTIQEVSEFLEQNNIQHGCFHGGMEQRDRETALIKFRNGTHQLLIATDLAARGIDVPEIKFILHFQLPPRPDEFIHRNGRTARMNADGTAYVLKWKKEELPAFIKNYEIVELEDAPTPTPSIWTTLYISGGRRDKISKGDIAGLFFKQGELKKDELGIIEIKQDCAYVAVHTELSEHVIQKVNNSRLKKKKVRVSIQY
ncbi:MAG: DEAD/DEAH box helicase [Salinivirgaceae bacterium]|jgi:superfamily II DNA/RNA helicase|nr:DEAD/DEAH box helicase [Salinivirgaceae bacterium]